MSGNMLGPGKRGLAHRTLENGEDGGGRVGNEYTDLVVASHGGEDEGEAELCGQTGWCWWKKVKTGGLCVDG